MLAGATGLAVALALTIGRRTRTSDPGDAAASAKADAPVIELSGCAAIVEGPVCELPEDGALRVVVHGPANGVTFATDQAGRAASTTIHSDGETTLVGLVVPVAARELRVTSGTGSVRTMRLAPSGAPAWLIEAKAARKRGDAEAALKLAKAAANAQDPVERAFSLGLRARLELAAGKPDASFPLFRESASLHRKAGRLSDAADDSLALAFALNQRSHRYADARAVLDDVRTYVTSYPDGQARESYYRGTLATETGEARSALRLLKESRALASRLGLAVLERTATNAYALQLELVGRVREALVVLRKLESDAGAAADASPCEKIEIAINLGFGALLANEQAAADAPQDDPVPALERALQGSACKDTYLRTAALGNLSLAALQRGEPSVARTFLAQAQQGTGASEGRAAEVLFWHELEGRIALAEKDGAKALAAFDEEARAAAMSLSFESEWRAAVGRGEALERLGRDDAALESYRAAESRLTTVALGVPLGEGRGTFVGDRQKSARLAVDLLVRRGRASEALTVVRLSRSRLVQGLAQSARVEGLVGPDRVRWENALSAYRSGRAALDAEAKDDWKLPRAEVARARPLREQREAELRAALDETFAAFAPAAARPDQPGQLVPLPGDAVTVAFHPLRKGWVGLVADGREVTSFTLARLPSPDDPTEQSALLMTPLRAHLERARRLRVLPYGALRAIDFHALPFDGEPLGAKVPVEYPLDLPLGAARAPAAAKPAALVVADPTLDLESARSESEHVVKALAARGGWEVSVLEGPRATSAAILPLLRDSQLLHYAGHGVFAGRDGWQSALPLAAGGHLGIADVLAARTVPQRVVLSGCEAARSSDDAPSESLGLAQAFVVGGADFVIAPVRPIADDLAARMATALYGELAESGPIDAARALRDAQLRVRSDAPALDWSAFRVVSR